MPFAAASPDRLWPVLNVLLAAFLLIWPIRSPFWNKARGIKPQRPALYWGILALEAAIGMWLLVASLRGVAGGGAYSAGVAWCLLVAIVTFVAQVFNLLRVEKD